MTKGEKQYDKSEIATSLAQGLVPRKDNLKTQKPQALEPAAFY